MFVFAVGVWSRRWIADDGLIYSRVAEQLLDGNGPTYGSLVRAEVATGPLWLFVVSTLVALTPFSTDAVSVGTGGVCAVAGLALGAVVATRLARGPLPVPGGITVPFGVAAFGLWQYAWDFSTSGMELGAVLLWLAVSADRLERTSRTRRFTASTAFVLGLGPLLRPDLALVAALFLLACLRWGPRPSGRQALGLLVAAGALPVLWQLFRMGYYGALVPNAGVAKEGTSIRPDQGLRYLIATSNDWFPVLAIPIVAAAAFVVPEARTGLPRRGARCALAGAGLLHMGYVILIGGDYMVGRLFLPGAFLVAMALGTVGVPRERWPRAAILSVILLAAGSFSASQPRYRDEDALLDERWFYVTLAQDLNPTNRGAFEGSQYTDAADAAIETAPPGSLVIITEVLQPAPALVMPLAPELADRFDIVLVSPTLGIIAAREDESVPVLDPLGLADPLASHHELQERGRPGHEKHLPPEWYVAWLGDPAAAPPSGVDTEGVAAARRALRCGGLADLLEATTEPLDAASFLRNLVSSPRLTTFRFDPDPVVAEVELCD